MPRLRRVPLSLSLLATLLVAGLVARVSAGEGEDRLRDVFHSLRSGDVAIFDLDDTLFRTTIRSTQALQDFAAEPSTRARFPVLARHVSRVTELRHHRYFAKESLARIGLTQEQIAPFAKAFFPYWKERFFSNEGALLDPTIPGAVGFVRMLHSRGVRIAYLTGRDEPRMGEGSRAALVKRGFPLGERARLFLKPDAETDDLVFKKRAFREIAKLGTVRAFFDNEPKNVLAAAGPEGFSEATCFFLDTVNSGGMAPLVGRDDIFWIENFLIPVR